jgi:hypothetical protein
LRKQLASRVVGLYSAIVFRARANKITVASLPAPVLRAVFGHLFFKHPQRFRRGICRLFVNMIVTEQPVRVEGLPRRALPRRVLRRRSIAGGCGGGCGAECGAAEAGPDYRSEVEEACTQRFLGARLQRLMLRPECAVWLAWARFRRRSETRHYLLAYTSGLEGAGHVSLSGRRPIAPSAQLSQQVVNAYT